jgi:hypothetical protein
MKTYNEHVFFYVIIKLGLSSKMVIVYNDSFAWMQVLMVQDFSLNLKCAIIANNAYNFIK